MDDISHILWSIVIFYHGNWLLAALFGILPDILVFLPFYLVKFSQGKLRSTEDLKPKGNINFYKPWVHRLYACSHSLLVAFAIIAGLSLSVGYHVEYWAMVIHILVDIPSHKRAWFGTKVFWPLHSWQFNGGDWATRDFMLANYTALALVYGMRLFGL